METAALIRLLGRWWWLIGFCTILGGYFAYEITTSLPRVYEASATLLLKHSSPDGETSYDTLMVAQQMAKTYSRMILQQPVVSAVIKNLQMEGRADSLTNRVQVDVLPNTSLIKITVTGKAGDKVESIARGLADTFVEQTYLREAKDYDLAREGLTRKLAQIEKSIEDLEANRAPSTAGKPPDVEQAIGLMQNNRTALLTSIAKTELSSAHLRSNISVVELTKEVQQERRLLLTTVVGSFAGLVIALAFIFIGEMLLRRRTGAAVS